VRDYGKLFSEFWTSTTIQALSDDAKMLAAYLLTNSHGTLIGCYRLPDGYVADDLLWKHERVAKGFAELSAKGFATRCETTKYVLIHKYLEWNPLENPNQKTGGKKMFVKVPDSLYGKGDLAERLGIEDWEPLGNPLPTLPQPVTVTVAGAVEGTVTVKGAGVATAEKSAAPRTNPVWNLYADGYEKRYGVSPIRNRKANALLAQFLERVGAEEAPAIAAFYVRSNRGLYVSAKHALELLVRDAEGMRTEWATNRTVTDTEARQTDRTQATGNVFGKLLSELPEAANAH